MRHSLYLAPIGLLAYVAEVATWPFAVEAAAMSAAIGIYAMRFALAPAQGTARAMFRFSLMYLPALLALMAVHRTPNSHAVGWVELEAKARGTLGFAAEGLTAGSERGYGYSLGGLAGAMEGLRAAVGEVVSRIDGDIVMSYVKCPSKVHCKEIEAAGTEADASRQELQLSVSNDRRR